MKIVSVLCVLVLLLAPSFALAHPHFNKTVTAKLASGAEATITYMTTPANLSRAESAEEGTFVSPRGPKLMLSAAAMSGGTEIPAGEYTIGVIKNADDWTMALYKGGLGRGETPDDAKIIKLDSMYSSDAGSAEHMLIDITPGHGKLEGKAVLTLHFGTMLCSGAIS